MLLFATFYGDECPFSYVIDTSLLDTSLQKEVKDKLSQSKTKEIHFTGFENFDALSEAKTQQGYPLTIDGAVEVYME